MVEKKVLRVISAHGPVARIRAVRASDSAGDADEGTDGTKPIVRFQV